MKEYLLPDCGQFYKANLHCHSTCSDGRRTPQELKDGYKAHGYSVLAITDHEYLVDHTDLSDDDFLLLNGYEAYVKENTDAHQGRFMKTVHLNFIAKNADVKKQICVDPIYIRYAIREHKVEELPRVGAICSRNYNPGFINRMISTANSNGFLVFYNHPSWSRETPMEIVQYHGLIGMEVFNYGVNVYEGYPGDDAKTYDLLLRSGQKLFAFANDDNHNKMPEDDPLFDSYGAFNMIKAPKLEYASIITALEQGDFYCSTGPEIYELYMEDGVLNATFSGVQEAYLVTEGRGFAPGRFSHIVAANGTIIKSAKFPILNDDGYFRLEIHDAEGKKAFTRGYFLDDLKEQIK